jgi:hypothetical protein
MQGILVTKIPDPHWGYPTIARVLPKNGDPWGILEGLEGTPWDPLFPRVDDLTLDQALRGFATPLVRVLGPPPKALVKRLPVIQAQCRWKDTCVGATKNCVPGPKVPDCWESAGIPESLVPAISHVVKLWREGIHVVLLQPP